MGEFFGSPLFAVLGGLLLGDGFFGSTLFFVIGGVVVVGLIVLLLYMRNQKSDDD